MSKLKALTVLITLTVVLPISALGDFDYPKLPWYEKYFFPIGAWSYPYYECVPDSDYDVDPDPKHNSPKADITWSNWNARFNAINFDEYYNLGLDFAKFQCYYHPYVKDPEDPYDKPSPPHRTTYEKRLYKNIL